MLDGLGEDKRKTCYCSATVLPAGLHLFEQTGITFHELIEPVVNNSGLVFTGLHKSLQTDKVLVRERVAKVVILSLDTTCTIR